MSLDIITNKSMEEILLQQENLDYLESILARNYKELKKPSVKRKGVVYITDVLDQVKRDVDLFLKIDSPDKPGIAFFRDTEDYKKIKKVGRFLYTSGFLSSVPGTLLTIAGTSDILLMPLSWPFLLYAMWSIKKARSFEKRIKTGYDYENKLIFLCNKGRSIVGHEYCHFLQQMAGFDVFDNRYRSFIEGFAGGVHTNLAYKYKEKRALAATTHELLNGYKYTSRRLGKSQSK